MIRLELRNVPLELVESYLAGVGGKIAGGMALGEGWNARLVRGEAAQVGRFRVPVLFVEIEGEREDEVARYLRLKTMRGGG